MVHPDDINNFCIALSSLNTNLEMVVVVVVVVVSGEHGRLGSDFDDDFC